MATASAGFLQNGLFLDHGFAAHEPEFERPRRDVEFLISAYKKAVA